MPLNDYQIPPVANWSTFEDLCRDLWAYEWKDINTQKNGRAGQSQHGVDVLENMKENYMQYSAKVKIILLIQISLLKKNY